MKQEHDLDKKMSENMLKKLNQQKEKLLKNDSINIRADEMLSFIIKSVMKNKDKKKLKKNEKNKSNVRDIRQIQIDKLTSKFKFLVLNLNVLFKQLKQQEQSCKMSRQSNSADSDYASNFRSTCYKYDKTEHSMRNCVKINTLINQEIIHQDDTDCLA